MKIKIFCFILIIFLVMPLIPAENLGISTDEKNIIFKNQYNGIQSSPFIGLSIVFFVGKATVYDYNDTALDDITVRPDYNKIKWFCLSNPLESGSASGSLVISLHDIRGYIGPKPIVENGNINFIFVLAKDIVIMKP